MDFSYLNSISDGDMTFIKQFVTTFKSNTETIIASLRKAQANGSDDDLKKLAHQLKPSLQMLELPSLQIVIDIQDDPSATTEDSINSIEQECQEAVEVMKKEFNL
ncbi:MAG: Hpt domain-containing protein [Marinoscillum sp.]